MIDAFTGESAGARGGSRLSAERPGARKAESGSEWTERSTNPRCSPMLRTRSRLIRSQRLNHIQAGGSQRRPRGCGHRRSQQDSCRAHHYPDTGRLGALQLDTVTNTAFCSRSFPRATGGVRLTVRPSNSRSSAWRQARSSSIPKRLCQLLRYLVAQRFERPHEHVKEYQIAQDVLGRLDSFDPHTDSAVRVQTSRPEAAGSRSWPPTSIALATRGAADARLFAPEG